MARYSATGASAAALATGVAFASIVPAAAVGFRLVRVVVGMLNAGGTPVDFNIGVGINRGTARAVTPVTIQGVKCDPDSGPSVISGVDTTWATAPALGAADSFTIPYNTRGGADTPYGVLDVVSTVGVANPINLVQRSGAALPAGHTIAWSIIWEE